MEEREASKETTMAIFETKLDNLLLIVNEIKDNMNYTVRDIEALKMDIVSLKNQNQQQKDEIERIYKKNEQNKAWIMSVAGTVIATIIIAILKLINVL